MNGTEVDFFTYFGVCKVSHNSSGRFRFFCCWSS